MKPPYSITKKILKLVSSISEMVGEVKTASINKKQTELRKENRIKTIQASLEIEGNTMNVEQITDIINNKRVIAPKKDIIEVKNAIKVYNLLHEFDAYKLSSLLEAHKILMSNLIEAPGNLRTTSVGIMKGNELAHIAPAGNMVYSLMNNLFDYLKNADDLLLIKSCVFHYELEFIHPFADGNGRMGRLWQTVILKEYSQVFEYLQIETLIKEQQQEYYNVLGKSDKHSESTFFIEFILEIIQHSLKDLLNIQKIDT